MESFKIIEILDRTRWDDFVMANGGQFLQSWQWGEFQKSLGRKIWRFRVENNGLAVSQFLVVRHSLPWARSYFYCPRGPVFHSVQSELIRQLADKTPARLASQHGAGRQNAKLLNLFFDKIIELAKQENAIFLRIEPLNKDILFEFCDLGFKMVATPSVQPPQTTILDIVQSEEKILSQMHSKTRYNIRLAEKYKVRISEDKSERSVKEFLNLIHQTAEREKFKPHPDSYYSQILKLDSDFVRLYLAEYKNKIIAAHLVVYFGKTATYIHGASTRQDRQVMAPHLLHWEIIKQAKQRGFQFYDFWGVNEKKWPGLTRFKMSFGGRIIDYPGTFDLPICKFWYYLYRLGKFIRKL